MRNLTWVTVRQWRSLGGGPCRGPPKSRPGIRPVLPSRSSPVAAGNLRPFDAARRAMVPPVVPLGWGAGHYLPFTLGPGGRVDMLHVTLLGEQVIYDDGSGAATRSSRTVALVAYLAAHAGRPQARQLIAGLFWPESTEAQALTNLRRELH